MRQIKDVKMPCPFCGSTKVYVTDKKSYEKNKNGCVCIECTGCSTDVWDFGNGDEDRSYKKAYGKAMAKWHTRYKEWDEP